MGVSRPGAALGALLGVLAIAGGLARAEVGVWQERTPPVGPPGARASPAMAYDSARGRTVLFGGATDSDTWEWDGGAWTRVASTGPSPRGGHAMAYDAARGVTVLFGGLFGGTTLTNETWEWDGNAWTLRASGGPSSRYGPAMAYDSGRGVTVLFGGTTGGGETWEWDGSAWTLRAQNGPAARRYAAMAYDSGRRVTVLYGGNINGFGQADTWEWDGTTWTRRAASGGVGSIAGGGRFGHAMAYDSARKRTVLFGGTYDTFTDSPEIWQTWEWDGTAWSQHGAPGPTQRLYPAMAYDSGHARTVLFGGTNAIPFSTLPTRGDTWTWDGTAWFSAATSPSPRELHAMAYDSARDRTVLFGGSQSGLIDSFGDTWEWDGGAWSMRATGGPTPRQGAALAYDEARAQTVLFGGYDDAYFGDTWTWDGARWTLAASTGPPARAFLAMAYDGARRRMVLFGGAACDATCQLFGDTWEWDGTSWSQVSSSGPRARTAPGMAWDGARGRTVLFGGGEVDDFGDTWEWDGSAWTQVAVTGPEPREMLAMAYDGARGRTVMFGGYSFASNAELADTWEWDGTTWAQVPSSGPLKRSGHTMVFEGARGRTLLYGGASSFTSGDTWEYFTQDAPPPDAGPPDAVVADAGVPEAGAPDAEPPDAAMTDGPALDAGTDAHDAPADDGSVAIGEPVVEGCSCSCRVGGASAPSGLALAGLIALVTCRRRPRRRPISSSSRPVGAARPSV